MDQMDRNPLIWTEGFIIDVEKVLFHGWDGT